MRRVLGIYGSDRGYRFHADKIEFGSIGRVDFDRFVDKDRIDIRRLFLAPLGEGEELPLDLGPFDLIVNYIADVDVNPRTRDLACAVCDAAPELPVINHPAFLDRSRRHRTSALLSGLDGLVVPRCELAPRRTGAELARFVEESDFTYPIIVRPVGSQTGQGLEKIDDPTALARRFAQGQGAVESLPPYYVTEYHEYGSADGVYRKARFFVADGVPLPQHVYMDLEWSVHGSSRSGLLLEREDLRAEELAFLEAPEDFASPALMKAIPEIGRRLGLDFFGLDCNFLADGRTLVFEANAAMIMSPAQHFPPGYEYIEPARAAIIEAMNQMLLRDRETLHSEI